jgi:hypothetical protein
VEIITGLKIPEWGEPVRLRDRSKRDFSTAQTDTVAGFGRNDKFAAMLANDKFAPILTAWRC